MVYQERNVSITDKCRYFELAAFTTIGEREDQQDCFAYHLKETEGMAVLCDGMGGHDAGADASRAVSEHFIKKYEEKNPEENEISFLEKTINESNDIVKNLRGRDGNPVNAGTTAVAVIINENKLYWCSAGDSRAYLFRKGEFIQFTTDQNYRTVLEENKRAGIISEEEFQTESSKADSLISYIGINQLQLIDYNEKPLELRDDDRIVIMSDGLYKMVSDAEISRLLDNFSNISDTLNALEMKTRSNAKGKTISRDNMTILIIKITNKENNQ